MRYYPAPIIDRKIRFALVRCGRIAKNHLSALKQHSARAELVDVVGPIESIQAYTTTIDESTCTPL